MADMRQASAQFLRLGELIPGDHLTREEFVRLWEKSPGLKRAELIGATVYLPLASTGPHDQAERCLRSWLEAYEQVTPGCQSGGAVTWFMLGDAPQPDGFLRLDQACGGPSFVEGDVYQGAPELAIEVCHSRTAYDLHQKKALYARAGVQEYLAVLLREKEVRWGRLVEGDYRPLLASPDGSLHSLLFPGLWLDTQALWEGDSGRMQQVLAQGLNSGEHSEFIARLAARTT